MSLDLNNDLQSIIQSDIKELKTTRNLNDEDYIPNKKEYVEEMEELDKRMEAARKKIFDDIDIEMLFPTQLKSYYASAEF